MLMGSKTSDAREFHVLVLADTQVVADRIVHCPGEADAFAEARSIVASVAARHAGDVSGYVLDHHQAFLGAVDGKPRALASAA